MAALLGASLLALTAGLTPVAASAALLPYESTVQPLQLAQATHMTVAPVVDRGGALYFGQTQNGLIMRMAPDGEQTPWATLPGIRGHKILPDGRHILLGQATVIEAGDDGHTIRTVSTPQPLIAPHSATEDGALGYYFTDSGTSDTREVEARGSVWQVDRFHVAHLAAQGLLAPTGIAIGSGGTRLYVVESTRNRVLSYPIARNGDLGAPRVFATLPAGGLGSDGMPSSSLGYGIGRNVASAAAITEDAQGDFWIAHYGAAEIIVLDATGTLLRRYPAGMRFVTGVVFGGAEIDQLYMTGAQETPDGSGAIVRLDLGLPGLGLPYSER